MIALLYLPATTTCIKVYGSPRRGAWLREATSLAVLSVSVLGDKVFSPQYLIWLAPIWAYWPLRRGLP